MARLIDPLLAEFDQEAALTRRLLERVPGDKLDWKPHAKSMSLGQLALHVATVPGDVAKMISADGLDIDTANFEAAPLGSASELIPRLDESLRMAKEMLGALDDQKSTASWRLTRRDKVIIEAPRIALVRSLALNHWIHHRGQLSVYLRLLDVQVPATYGRSADENPFAAE